MAPAHLDQPAVSDRMPRPRVAYLESGPDQWLGDRPNMYETDWSPRRHRRRRSGRGRSVVLVMTAVAAAAGGVAAVGRTGQPAAAPVAVDAAFSSARPQATASATVRARVSSSPAPRAKTPSPRAKTSSPTPEPVTGLDQRQMNNAALIVRVARERQLPRRAMLVALMTGLQESGLRNLANPTVPASLDKPHEGSGDNFDSLGIFQQRPSQGWGSVAELMTPRYAAGAFYERLLRVDDWESKSLGDAAQAVQRSAVPDAYADHEDRATRIVDALL